MQSHQHCVERFFVYQPKSNPEKNNARDDTVNAQSNLTIPSKLELGSPLCEEKEALCFLKEKGFIAPIQTCPNCNNHLVLMSQNLSSKLRFVLYCHCCCTGHACSMLTGTIPAKCKLNKAKFIDFVCHWLLVTEHNTMEKSLGVSFQCES